MKQGFTTKRQLIREELGNEPFTFPAHAIRTRFADSRRGRRAVDGFQPTDINEFGIDGPGVIFMGMREVVRYDPECRVSRSTVPDAETTARKEHEWVLVLDDRGRYELESELNDIDFLKSKYQEMIEILDRDRKRYEKIENNPSLKKAWENFKTLEALL